MVKPLFPLAFLIGASTVAKAAVVLFTFENGEAISGGSVYGTPGSFPAMIRDGFIVDVRDTGGGASAHFHEVADPSLVLDKIPGTRLGVLWRDSNAGQDPLFFAPATPTFVFTLDSLLLSASAADNSQTYAVQLSAFRNGANLGSVELPAIAGNPDYTEYSGSSLGALEGLSMDRLEMVGLSASGISYYQLDNVAFTTTAVPEPGTLAWSIVTGTGLLGLVLHRRRTRNDPESN